MKRSRSSGVEVAMMVEVQKVGHGEWLQNAWST